MPSFIRIQDLADILIMTFLLYQLYCWFRRTRAMQVLLGLGVVTLIYFVTRFLGLYMTSWILQELGTVLIILIIVVFQAEIRQALYRFSLMRNFFDPRENERHSKFQEIAETVFRLAEKRTGAILVFQRGESLSDLMLNGVNLDCEITPQILEAIFADGTPLHDGAALIRGERIAQASCHLPLSASSDIPQCYGTRHRAALGLSERSDAVVVVVSEERGEVLLAEAGEFQKTATAGELVTVLEERISPAGEKPRLTVWQRLYSNLLPKTALLIIVTTFWILIASRQGDITTVSAPVRLHSVPDELVVVKSVPEEVEVQLKSLSRLTPAPAKLALTANVDLSDVRDGQMQVRIKNSDFELPSGMVITSISPSTIKIATEKRVRKRVPVRVMLKGRLSPGLRGYMVVAEPADVEIEGPAGHVARFESISTEDVDAGYLVRGKEYRKSLLLPSEKVTVTRDESVYVKLAQRKYKR